LACRKALQAQQYKGHASTQIRRGAYTSDVSYPYAEIRYRSPSKLACRKDLQAQRRDPCQHKIRRGAT
jgi:hypothetical protein